jgi:glycerol uptake facilitator-like aquaporin
MKTGSGRVGEVALWRRQAAEFLGSAFLVAPVIGSGIAAGLFAIILMFGPVSGGHLQPRREGAAASAASSASRVGD